MDSGRTGSGLKRSWLQAVSPPPHLLPVEVASVIRRATASGDLSADVASMAHADLLALRVELFPYEPFAQRVWELRDNVTPHDAWYVAVAEALDAPLATLDHRLQQAVITARSIETETGR